MSINYLNIFMNNQSIESNKKIYLDKLFPKINGVNIQNLSIDIESVSYITTPSESKKISEIIIKHSSKYKLPKESTIVDATGGAGGDTISFCNFFGSVISIELDPVRFEFLKHNVQEYQYKNIMTINGDSTIIIPKLSYLDIIYVDPPWGGKDYKSKENLRLVLGNIELEAFILNCFNKEYSTAIPSVVALKLPKNYDIKHLFGVISEKLDIYLYELKKINILIIEKKCDSC